MSSVDTALTELVREVTDKREFIEGIFAEQGVCVCVYVCVCACMCVCTCDCCVACNGVCVCLFVYLSMCLSV